MIKVVGASNHAVGPLAITKTLVEAAINKKIVTIWNEGEAGTDIKITKKMLVDLRQDLLNFRDKHEKEDLQLFKAKLEGNSANLKLGLFSPLDMNIMRTYLDNNLKNVPD